MKRTVKADYSRTCEGCRFLVTEPWLKDVPSFRCGADGRCKGYMHSENTGRCGNEALYLRRAPQSWCYVEERHDL